MATTKIFLHDLNLSNQRECGLITGTKRLKGVFANQLVHVNRNDIEPDVKFSFNKEVIFT